MSANADGLRETLRHRCDSAFLSALDATGVEMTVAAPYATGETVDSLDVELGDAGPLHYSATIRFTAPQALWTDEGTRPHDIEGNPWLVFDVGGQTVFVRSPAVVHHPGTERTGWFSDSIGPTFEKNLRIGFADG